MSHCSFPSTIVYFLLDLGSKYEISLRPLPPPPPRRDLRFFNISVFLFFGEGLTKMNLIVAGSESRL